MRYPRAFGLSLALATLTIAARAETVTLQGTVAERFGPKLVPETSDGRVLVDGGPDWRGAEAPGPGAAVTVTGRATEAGLAAARLLLPDGREIVIAGTVPEVDALDPTAMAAVTDRLAEAGIGAPRLVATTSRPAISRPRGPAARSASRPAATASCAGPKGRAPQPSPPAGR